MAHGAFFSTLPRSSGYRSIDRLASATLGLMQESGGSGMADIQVEMGIGPPTGAAFPSWELRDQAGQAIDLMADRAGRARWSCSIAVPPGDRSVRRSSWSCRRWRRTWRPRGSPSMRSATTLRTCLRVSPSGMASPIPCSAMRASGLIPRARHPQRGGRAGASRASRIPACSSSTRTARWPRNTSTRATGSETPARDSCNKSSGSPPPTTGPRRRWGPMWSSSRPNSTHPAIRGGSGSG